MLQHIRLAVAVILIALVGADLGLRVSELFVVLQPPIPSAAETGNPPQATTEQSKNDTETDQRGSSESPFFVHVVPTQEEAKQEANDRLEKSANDRWTVIFSGSLVIVTVALVGATSFLWRATRRLVIGADKTAERQLRAYVFPRKPEIIGLFSDKPRMTCRIRNFGQTPAYDLNIAATIFLGVEPLREVPVPDRFNYPPDFALGPSGECVIFREAGELNAHQVADIRSGRMAIYFRGIVTYKDAFDGTPLRTTEFTLMKSGLTGLEDQNLAVRPIGNRAT